MLFVDFAQAYGPVWKKGFDRMKRPTEHGVSENIVKLLRTALPTCYKSKQSVNVCLMCKPIMLGIYM